MLEQRIKLLSMAARRGKPSKIHILALSVCMITDVNVVVENNRLFLH